MDVLAPVIEQSKSYEFAVVKADPRFADMVRAIEIFREFIIEHGLIIYGGSAINYALELHGDYIYPPETDIAPDLDVYSDDNCQHAYRLADKLYGAGFTDTRVINALHIETMRVDIGDNHFIADISFRPRDVFNKLPTLTYNGMKVIHPIFQRIDLHSSLAFPYDNVPREVIFERWEKDIKRFNKLAKYYQPPYDGKIAASHKRMKVESTWLRKFVYTGYFAYALVYAEYKNAMNVIGIPPDARVIPATVSYDHIDDDHIITYDTVDSELSLVHFDPLKALKIIGQDGLTTDRKHYRPYINLIPERYVLTHNRAQLTVFSTRGRLIVANSIEIADSKISVRIVGVQALLRHFLATYYFNDMNGKHNIAQAALGRYVSLLAMIESFESAIRSDDDIDLAHSLLLTHETYGFENINLSREVVLAYLYHDLKGTDIIATPKNYYPSRVDQALPNEQKHPQFKFSDHAHFQQSSELIVDVDKSVENANH